eukprot:1427128-Amphidinium_carterae.2
MAGVGTDAPDIREGKTPLAQASGCSSADTSSTIDQHLTVVSVVDGMVNLMTSDFRPVQMPDTMLPADLEVGQ